MGHATCRLSGEKVLDGVSEIDFDIPMS
jgi:hypothetical protein